MDEKPRYWYISTELRREITTWEDLIVCFAHTFGYKDVNAKFNNVLQIIQDIVLKVVPATYPLDPHALCRMQSMMESYNLYGEPEDDDELGNITETGGIQDVIEPDV